MNDEIIQILIVIGTVGVVGQLTKYMFSIATPNEMMYFGSAIAIICMAVGHFVMKED